jgi:hypothetical protein
MEPYGLAVSIACPSGEGGGLRHHREVRSRSARSYVQLASLGNFLFWNHLNLIEPFRESPEEPEASHELWISKQFVKNHFNTQNSTFFESEKALFRRVSRIF